MHVLVYVYMCLCMTCMPSIFEQVNINTYISIYIYMWYTNVNACAQPVSLAAPLGGYAQP